MFNAWHLRIFEYAIEFYTTPHYLLGMNIVRYKSDGFIEHLYQVFVLSTLW